MLAKYYFNNCFGVNCNGKCVMITEDYESKSCSVFKLNVERKNMFENSLKDRIYRLFS